MIISDEQALRVAEYLGCYPTRIDLPFQCRVCSDVVDRARSVAMNSPDSRQDRVEDAKARLVNGLPNSTEIATKMVSRILCDSIG